MRKLKRGDPVLIYDNPAWVGGGCGIIKDIDISDPNNIVYLVANVVDQEMDYYVKREFLFKLTFTKPTFFDKIKMLFFN